jgi:hypothetical protein
LLLCARTEASSAAADRLFLANVRARRLPAARIRRSARRILELKRALKGMVPSSA